MIDKEEFANLTIAQHFRNAITTPQPTDLNSMNILTKTKFIQREENRNENQWKTVAKYWRADFREDSKMKKPLINEKKRKIINQLIKNDHLTVRGVHNGMMERVVFSD